MSIEQKNKGSVRRYNYNLIAPGFFFSVLEASKKRVHERKETKEMLCTPNERGKGEK